MQRVVTSEPNCTAIKDLLFVRVGKRLAPVWTSDVEWIAAAGNYVRIHTSGGAYVIRATLQSVLASLDPLRFVQIHKSTVINLTAVAELQPWFSGEMRVLLKDGTMLKLSRTFRQLLEQRVRFLS